QLLQDVLHVALHRELADREHGRDVLVPRTARDELEHLALAQGEERDAAARVRTLVVAVDRLDHHRGEVALEGRLAAGSAAQRAHETLLRDRLVQEAVRPGPNGGEDDLGRRVEAPHDRGRRARARQLPDGRAAAGRGQIEIDEAEVRTVALGGGEQLLDRCRLRHVEAPVALQQVAHAGADDREGVGDEDARPRHEPISADAESTARTVRCTPPDTLVPSLSRMTRRSPPPAHPHTPSFATDHQVGSSASVRRASALATSATLDLLARRLDLAGLAPRAPTGALS